MWDERFESIMRVRLQNFGSDLPLAPDLVLAAHGLDSMGMIGLISSLEEEYFFTLPDEAMTPENFVTPKTIWETIQTFIPARGVSEESESQ